MIERFIINSKKQRIYYPHEYAVFGNNYGNASFKEIKDSLFPVKTEDGWTETYVDSIQNIFLFWKLLRKRKISNVRRKVQNI